MQPLLNNKIIKDSLKNFLVYNQNNFKNLQEYFKTQAVLAENEELKEDADRQDFLTKMLENLGYEKNVTYTFENKTEIGQKKADGILGTKDENGNWKVEVAIEWKGSKIDLDKMDKAENKTPVSQGWDYLGRFEECRFFIVGNFKEWRLYSRQGGQTKYQLFKIEELAKSEEKLTEMFLLLTKENLLRQDNKISWTEQLILKAEQRQADISKDFYNDYKNQRNLLFNHLIENNPQIEKNILLNKTQKILDRLVFMMFCEDSNDLLPKNLTKEIYQLGAKSRERSDEKIWQQFKNIFMDIDEGRDDLDPKITGYNGGLFKSDEILDNLSIKDDIWENLVKLAEYDFESDLNVNILGHIFEQSLSDIEQMKAELLGEVLDKKKSKRKKDGIFYTPEYITKFIVENTIGKFLEENPDKLAEIKILDPACGSGAFLNQAHGFLLEKWRENFEKGKIKSKDYDFGGMFEYNPLEADKSILNNNLFGVDLNEESVEIAKLALWLKTARKNQKLQNLDGNIKCGNSLIDDVAVAGEKVFDWEKEFPKIIKKYKVTIDNNIISNYFNKDEGDVHEKAKFLFSDNRIQLYVSDTVLKESYGNLDEITNEDIKNKIEKEKCILKNLIKNGQLKKINDRPCGFSIGCIPTDGGTVLSKKALENREKDLNKRYHNVDTFQKMELKINKRTNLKNDYVIADAHRRVGNDFILTNNVKDFKENDDLKIVGYDELFKILDEFGFDCIIGNPPYVSANQIDENSKKWFEKNYNSAYGRLNLFSIFLERGINLLKRGGFLGFIIPYTILKNQYFKEIRKFILENTSIISIVDFQEIKIFEDAVVDSVIIILKKEIDFNSKINYLNKVENLALNNYKKEIILQSDLKKNEDFAFNMQSENLLLKKIFNNSIKLQEIVDFNQGIITGDNKKFITKEENQFTKKIITGKNIERYQLNYDNEFIIYDTEKLHRSRNKEIFEVKEKILLRQTGSYPIATIDFDGYYTLDTIHNGKILRNDFILKYILTLLNSKLFRYIYSNLVNEEGKVFAQVKIIYINSLPIKKATENQQQSLATKAEQMLAFNQELHEKTQKALELLTTKYNPKNLSTSLKTFYKLDWKELTTELEKQKVKLSLRDQEDLQDWFSHKKPELLNLSTQIENLDQQIDTEVFDLYELTAEERRLVCGD